MPVTLIYLRKLRKAGNRGRAICCFLFLQRTYCFQIAPLFEQKEVKGEGTQVVNIGLSGKEKRKSWEPGMNA